nr:phosphoribosylformylglycinamidine synthase subunit PurL [Alicyclobacillus ferrooxydans]
MKWAVVVFPGSNCDEDAQKAVASVTGDPVDLVWHTEADLSAYDAIILPGGFSYGDYLRSGAIARFSPVMQAVSKEAAAGKLVVGICNGFQVLTESGLLPGALLRNEDLRFHCHTSELVVENTDSPFTSAYTKGETIRVPIAHGEGRYYADEETLAQLKKDNRILFRYQDNPNGSVEDIAGILNENRNVLGLMPHPERAVTDWMASEDGQRMFLSMQQAVKARTNQTETAAAATGTSLNHVLVGNLDTSNPGIGQETPEASAMPSETMQENPVEPSPEQIKEHLIYRDLGLTETEYQRAVELLGRLPNYVETGLFGVLWSEHCSYKSSKRYLRQFPTTGPQVLQGPGENAGVIDLGDGIGVAFKMESHNHPSAIEPVQGAATGVGGILRDVFTMGARPIAFLDSLRFGPLDDEHVRHLFRGVVEGIGMYGNCVGIPTVGGEVTFDPSYTANPLVNAMCVGVLPADKIVKGTATGTGNPVFVVGARTGRDGIHGATFASAEDPHTKERSAVQVGDPFLGKLLMEACLELIDTGAVVGIQDMGAAGLTSSSAEMASRAGGGMELYLNQVPVREDGMTPYEMMLSESQERMLVVLERGREDLAFQILRKWGLEVAEIGKVTDDGNLRLWFNNSKVADVPVRYLVDDAPVYDRPVAPPASTLADNWQSDLNELRTQLDGLQTKSGTAESSWGDALTNLLTHPTIAEKSWVYRQYDTSVRTSTVVGPGSDAAVVKLPDSKTCIALTTDGNGRYVGLNPRLGGAIAVAEAARNIVCSGGIPLAITNCLNFGNPEKPEIMYQFAEATSGMSEACEALGTPVVSGNVSLYNETGGRDIWPTPVIGMVGKITGVDAVIPSGFQQEGSSVICIGPEDRDLQGSLFVEELLSRSAGSAPSFDLAVEVAVQQFVSEVMQQGWVTAAHDVSEGGIAVTLAEMCMDHQIGAQIEAPISAQDTLAVAGWLFSEGQSRIVLEVPSEHVGKLLQAAKSAHVDARVMGQTAGMELVINGSNRSGKERLLVQTALQMKMAYESVISRFMSLPEAERGSGNVAVPGQ